MLHTRSFVTGLALVAGLLLPVGAAESVAAAPKEPVRRSVEYGDGAVKVPSGRKAVISFEGRKGDIVSLDDSAARPARLYRAGHQVRRTWGAGGLWRLPRTGRFSFRAPSYSTDRRVRLTKARVHTVEVDGSKVRIPKARRGYIDLAAVSLRPGHRVAVDDGRYDNRLYYSDGSSDSFWGNIILLRTGDPARTDDGGLSGRTDVVGGTVLVRVASGHRVRVASAAEATLTADGPPVLLAPVRKAAREYTFAFTGTAGQLVYLEQADGSALPNYYQALNRFGSRIVAADDAQSFVLPADGTYELSLVTDRIWSGDPASLRLRLGVRVGDLVPDGAPTTFTFDGRGSRLYSLATGPGIRVEATPADLGPGEHWRLLMGPRQAYRCQPDPSGPLGCGEHPYVDLSDLKPADNALFGAPMPADAVAVATVAPGVTGSLSVRLWTTTTP